MIPPLPDNIIVMMVGKKLWGRGMGRTPSLKILPGAGRGDGAEESTDEVEGVAFLVATRGHEEEEKG